MPSAARSRSAHQQNGPVRSAGAGGKGFFPIYNVAPINFRGCGAKGYFFCGCACLRLATPGNPCFASLNNAAEPAPFLLVIGDPINQHHGIAMSFPAARQGKINFGEFFGDRPERVYISSMRPQSQTTVFRRNSNAQESGAVKVSKIFRRECSFAIIAGGTGSKVMLSKIACVCD